MAASFMLRMRDGTPLADIASIAFDKRLKRRLNRPSECHFRVPSYLVNEIQSDGRPLLCAGYRMLSVTLDSTGLFFHGFVWNVEEDGDEDMVYSQVSCYDPMIMWRFRPARDMLDTYSGEAGNFSDPSFIERNQSGPQIIEEILFASEGAGEDPVLDSEGPLFLDLETSTYETGGEDLRGAPTNWPMTIAEIATLLTNTGELDIVIEPLVSETPGTLANMGRVHCYNGNYGVNRTASVHFDYAMGDFNARLIRRTESMDTIGNKLWYYLGPRLDQQHWRTNIHGGLMALGELGNMRLASQAELGVFMLISIYDNFGSEDSARPLYVQSWLTETLLRLKPREMVYVTPVRGGAFGPGDFDIGDRITVNIGNKARVDSAGWQRIYSYEITIDDDAVEALGEFECSPDQDSI